MCFVQIEVKIDKTLIVLTNNKDVLIGFEKSIFASYLINFMICLSGSVYSIIPIRNSSIFCDVIRRCGNYFMLTIICMNSFILV